MFSARLWYVPMLAVSMGLMLLRLAIIAKMLPVSEFAAFSAGLLVSSSFCMLGCFGLQSLLQRDLPILIMRRRERAGEVLVMQCVLMAVAAAFFGIILVSASNGSLVGLTSVGLSISLFHGLSQQLFTVATIDSRSRNQPVLFARQNLERAIPLVIASPAIILLGGGSMTILIVEASITLLLFTRLLVDKFRWTPSAISSALRVGWRRMPNVNWRSAITLLAVSSLSFVVLNLDRWIAAQWLSANNFGQYAFAWTLISMAQSIQLIINASVYPTLSQKYALLGKKLCFSLALKLSIVTLISGIVISVIFYPVIEILISSIFKKYSAVLIIIPIFLAVAIFRISDFWSSFLIITGNEIKVLKTLLLTAISILLCWLLFLNFEKNNFSLIAIAILALSITFVNYIALAFWAWKQSR